MSGNKEDALLSLGKCLFLGVGGWGGGGGGGEGAYSLGLTNLLRTALLQNQTFQHQTKFPTPGKCRLIFGQELLGTDNGSNTH